MKDAIRALAAAGFAAAASAGAALAQPLDPVRVGLVSAVSDAPFLIADKKGYFREAGIQVTFQSFASGTAMVAPLGTGQLNVGAGAPAAGLYNAVGSGINVKIVADKGTDTVHYGFDPIVVRKDLVTSGKYKRIADLRGMKVAEPGKGSTIEPELQSFLSRGGLNYEDVQHVYLGFPEQVAALKNGSIDATIAIEPWATVDEREGVGVRIASNDTFYPDQQLAVVLYGGDFATKRNAVAKRFMIAYLRGARYYHDALEGGHIAGPHADEIIGILAEAVKVDPAILRAMTANNVNPNGRVGVRSLADDYAFFRKIGLVTENVSMSSIVDLSFIEDAVRVLGPYKRKS